jgi:DNA polymerase I-like protein with 3'-5' exonuclease and polymerase domains
MNFMCVDIETSGLDWTTDVMHGIGVGYDEHSAEYYLIGDVPTHVREDLADPSIAKIGHNFHAFDAKFIRKAGFEIRGEFHDPMILANLIDTEQPLGLKLLTDKYIGEENLERKRALDKYMHSVGVKDIGALCAKDLVDASHPHLDIIAEYCKEDVRNTTQLYFLLLEKLKEMDAVLKGPKFGFKKSPLDYYYEEAMPLEYVLFDIEYHGIRVNLDYINTIRDSALSRMADIEKKLSKALAARIHKTEDRLYDLAVNKERMKKTKAGFRKPETIAKAIAKIKPHEGAAAFKWSNNNHVALLLYQHCDLPSELVTRTAKGKYATDKAAIERILINLPATHKGLGNCLQLYKEYKLHQKISSTYTGSNKKGVLSKIRYVDGVPRIFPQYRQTTETGRLACKNPNMQNLKRDSDVKRFFIPDSPDEVFDDADYSQIELRTGAHVSGDVGLCTAYATQSDVHLLTASRLFGRDITKADDMERQAGKRTNFLTIFDGKAPRLAESLKADTGHYFTINQCKEFIRIWFETYPGVRAYLDAQKEFFEQHKFCISETGRVRRLPDIYFGRHLSWVKTGNKLVDEETGKERDEWKPVYEGPEHKKAELVQWILQKEKRLKAHQVTSDMIGRAAYRRYTHAVKAGYNQPIQGLAASMTKRAMIALHTQGRRIANQVHDNLTVTRKRGDIKAREQLVGVMENVYTLSVPVQADCKTLNSFHPKDTAKENE